MFLEPFIPNEDIAHPSGEKVEEISGQVDDQGEAEGLSEEGVTLQEWVRFGRE